MYDPDGRAAAINSTTYGTETNQFDADGRLTAVQEGSGGTFTSPALITYGYYADGERSSLSVQSTEFTHSNWLKYSYRADGPLESEALSWPMVAAFAWTYTSAGRELTQRDPYTGAVISLQDATGAPNGTRTLVPKTYTYDASGEISQLTLPEGYTMSQYTFDAEGETLSYARSGMYCYKGCLASTQTNKYTIRGELEYASSYTPSNAGGPWADGMQEDGSKTFDARSNMLLHQYGANQYAYDAAGRQTTITEDTQTAAAYTNPPQTYSGGVVTRAYDAENHLVQQAYSGTGSYYCGLGVNTQMCSSTYDSGDGGSYSVNPGLILGYGFGPSGHLATIAEPFGAGPMTAMSAHWDGDTLLFTSTGSTTVPDQVDIGKLASGYALNGGSGVFSVEDRDSSGSRIALHDGIGFTAMADMKQFYDLKKPYAGTSPAQPNYMQPTGDILDAARSDGYSAGYGNTFQGVRVFDPNMAQWTAPDAYAGDVYDPMSQKPFMWNNNNPLDFEDPSGYESGGCSINVNDCGVSLPKNTDFYAKGEVTGLGLAASVTKTATDHAYYSLPAFQGVSGNRQTPGLLKTATTVAGSATRSAFSAVRSTFGASGTIGIISPNKGKSSKDVISGNSTTISISAYGVVVEFGWNSSGHFAGVGAGSPGFAVTTTNGVEIKKDPKR